MENEQSKRPLNILVLGATSAIAMATTRIYAGRGASFYLVARDAQKLSVAAADAQVRGASTVCSQVFDLDDIREHSTLLANVARKLPPLDIALVAHGVLGIQGEAERDFFAAEAVFRTNFLSAVSLVTYLANVFQERKSGSIAVVASVAGDRGRKSNYIYGTSKAAVAVFLDGLRNRIDRHGVHIITIKPGFVASPMTTHLKQGILFASPETIARGIVRAIEHRKDVVYLPWFWRPIMSIIRSIPEPIFKRLNL